MNVNLYGCDGKWLMVDLGMTFSGGEYPGVDLVFADLDFIEERTEDLLGIVLTHAHEDHIGAVPYFAGELGVLAALNSFDRVPELSAIVHPFRCALWSHHLRMDHARLAAIVASLTCALVAQVGGRSVSR